MCTSCIKIIPGSMSREVRKFANRYFKRKFLPFYNGCKICSFLEVGILYEAQAKVNGVDICL